MQVTVRFFARLREEFQLERLDLTLKEGITVAEVWNAATAGHTIPPNTLAALNQSHCSWRDRVEAGGEVAFFPPVTGG